MDQRKNSAHAAEFFLYRSLKKRFLYRSMCMYCSDRANDFSYLLAGQRKSTKETAELENQRENEQRGGVLG
ncbi:hypothetical protein CLOSTMETH_01605 [[Clostridium] methylpentosum DSM 5476]|uniref:Uncharacterized protein n=1 Tax=[Clostridium] methylpentosum DSM 5476 TaxID=537013 RepID=C0ECN4_9FIRM|nr:hypothetical protein CLOSTMETH_01605 [[Clostridium] methylpentosum DSM 5476]